MTFHQLQFQGTFSLYIQRIPVLKYQAMNTSHAKYESGQLYHLWWRIATTVKGKYVGLKVLEFHPEYINNIFNRIINHIQIGKGLFVEFYHNLLNMQMLRSCKHIDTGKEDFSLHRKSPDSNCIVMYQILAPFPPQCQDVRTKCKPFLFIFVFRVAGKVENVRDNAR